MQVPRRAAAAAMLAGGIPFLLGGCAGTTQDSFPAERSADAATHAAYQSVEVSASGPASSGDLVARPLGSVEAAPLGYLEYLPGGYGDNQPRPLLVYLHSAGGPGDGSATDLERVEQEPLPQLIAAGDWPAARSFIVLAPQYGIEPAESDCDISADVAAFLGFATQHYEVDPSRVYLTGISCGAIGAWDYLAAHGDEVVAAAVPISGHAEWALAEAGCEPLASVPVWAFHGAQDDVVPTIHIEGSMNQVRACQGAESVEIELTVYPDADHDAWTRTYDLSAGHDIYAWLLRHTSD